MAKIGKDLHKQLVEFRHTLHQFPEVSGNEKQTAQRVKDFIRQYHPDKIIEDIGTYGLAFYFEGKHPGPVLAIRSELDALPVHEINEMAYRSETDGVGHKCGHDGHIAMIAGLAERFSNEPPERGTVVLLYQPEEETGTGALKMLKDEKMQNIAPDYMVSLHNLPGYPMGTVVCREGVFASASVGMIMRLKGKTSHAAEPENGNSPSMAMSEIITYIEKLTVHAPKLRDFGLATVIHAFVGERAFGTTPGYAEVMATLRAYHNEDLDTLKETARSFAAKCAEKYQLEIRFEWVEEFSTTYNSSEISRVIKAAAQKNALEYRHLKHPFRWSEDFGYFLQKYPGAMFGLGSGSDQPQLHNPDYDFPDALIPKGLMMFEEIARELLK